MARGLLVICYDHGGQTDYLAGGINGRLLPLNDQAAFVAAVKDMVEDPANRETVSQRNRAQVEAFFIDNCACRYESLFEQVLKSTNDHSSVAQSPNTV